MGIGKCLSFEYPKPESASRMSQGMTLVCVECLRIVDPSMLRFMSLRQRRGKNESKNA